MKFSIVLIARNESKTIPRLIISLKEFQERKGEIILLDTGSTDNTAEIARSLGCIVHEVGNKFRITIDKKTADQINQKYIVAGEELIVKENDSLFDYASARNYAAGLASNKMIAMPDCDEIYTKLDLDKINKIIESGVQQLEYQFVFAHDDKGNAIIQFLHSKFYNRQFLRWTGVIHEVLSGNASRQYLDESIIKLEHYQNVETNRNGYLVGLALDCFNNPNNDRNSHYFARELMYKNRFNSAIQQFKFHIDMDKWPEEKSQSALHIGECYNYLGNPDEAFKWYFKAVDICPNRREPFMKIAEYYFKRNSPKHTIIYAEAALSITETSFYSNYQPYYTNLPHELLYWAYWWTGNKAKSKEHYDIAYSMQPNNPKYIEERKFYYSQSDELEFTGERVVIDKMEQRPDILKEHLQRYEFATKYTKDLIVLDAACGSGYAKEILKAEKYYGVDIDPKTIKHAELKYGNGFSIENLEEGISLNIKPDVVISFETIEHLENPHNFLSWIKENTKLFIFSIPVNMPSEFHKQVYTTEQIKVLINKYFTNVSFFSQTDEIKAESNSAKYIIGIARTTELPKISIIIPSLGREEGLKRCLDSIDNLDYPKEKIEKIIIEGEDSVPFKMTTGLFKSTGDWILYAANDVEFNKDTLKVAITEIQTKNLKFLAFNTNTILPDEGNICEHFMIHKDIISLLDKGEIFSTEFNHVGVDNYLWAQLKKLNLNYRSDKAILKHYHFSTHNTMDSIYEKGWKNYAKDRLKLSHKLKELELK